MYEGWIAVILVDDLSVQPTDRDAWSLRSDAISSVTIIIIPYGFSSLIGALKLGFIVGGAYTEVPCCACA